eukprot:TRINITY_DN27254_c0_g2_i3.p2 TRINITY_DN27254_c0_g2~~TRINITY_DN27254_c0_g2_i3.p2  ORF type:complete len:103 (-),score=8.06 TRINITY_DN27254_c0_g2_i3:174-482(-)
MLQPEDSNIFVVHLMNMFCDIRLSLCNRLSSCNLFIFFFFNDTATTEIYTRSIVGSVRCVQETEVIYAENPYEQDQCPDHIPAFSRPFSTQCLVLLPYYVAI